MVRAESEAQDVFRSVVCGVAGTQGSTEALRQAERLLSPGGKLHLVAVAESGLAEAERALDEARALAAPATARVVEGEPTACLLEAIQREGGTTVAVGTHVRWRAAGVLLGSTTTELLHEAPCSVFVARPPDGTDRFPATMLVGVDGSPPSLAAAEVALALAERLEAECVVVTATGRGHHVDLAAIRERFPGVEPYERGPVGALADFSHEVDLLVVGSRGLHGVRALGSVSERVAHQAHCSVLVVR